MSSGWPATRSIGAASGSSRSSTATAGRRRRAAELGHPVVLDEDCAVIGPDDATAVPVDSHVDQYRHPSALPELDRGPALHSGGGPRQRDGPRAASAWTEGGGFGAPGSELVSTAAAARCRLEGGMSTSAGSSCAAAAGWVLSMVRRRSAAASAGVVPEPAAAAGGGGFWP